MVGLLLFVCYFAFIHRCWPQQLRIQRMRSLQGIACMHKACSYETEMLQL